MLKLILLAGLALVLAGCNEAHSQDSEEQDCHECHCEYTESAPVWSKDSKCPREKGWVMKGLGQTVNGVFRAECVKLEHKCACPVQH